MVQRVYLNRIPYTDDSGNFLSGLVYYVLSHRRDILKYYTPSRREYFRKRLHNGSAEEHDCTGRHPRQAQLPGGRLSEQHHLPVVPRRNGDPAHSRLHVARRHLRRRQPRHHLGGARGHRLVPVSTDERSRPTTGSRGLP